MKIVQRLFLLIFLCMVAINVQVEAQNEQQIEQKLKEQGITTKADVLAELKKRNLTEDDARRMAKQYGMDYDSFIATYIVGGKDLSLPQSVSTSQQPIPTGQTIPVNVVEEKAKVEEKKMESKVETQVSPTSSTNPTEPEYFGYNVFKNMPSSFEPSSVGPIDPGYIIGPGDVLRIYIWGAVEFQYQLEVDKEGNIFIPTAGQFFASGITYEELGKKLTNYLSKFYEGLAANPPTVFLDVSLAKLKPIRIFVLGEVSRPGGYNISSFATVFNALYSFGGPLTSGSLRDVRVIRNNKVITTVDLYDYLLRGQLIGDMRLQNNDIIFIPPRGRTILIKGEVLRPAYYELKETENLQKLIEFCGGLKSTAYIGRAQIERIIPFEKRKPFSLEREVSDVDLSKIVENKTTDYQLFDRDVLTIFPILDKLENYVTISGAVYRPGTYELSKVPRIKNLISEAYGLLPEAFVGKADIIRTRPDESFQFISINLANALKGDPKDNIQLEGRDQVKIYSTYEIIDKKTVSISGYVKQPVTLPYADSLTLYDMVFRAGGLEDPFFRGKALMYRGDLIRFNPDGVTTKILPFDLVKLLHDKSYNRKLEKGDQIIIYKADAEKVLDKYVTIEGDVKNPGKYDLSTNLTPMDLILRAGGFNESSDRSKVYVSRLKPNGYPGDKLSEVIDVPLPPDFEKSLKDSAVKDTNSTLFRLKHRDIVIVRKNPNFEPQRVVTIRGEVEYPGKYVLKNKNETLLALIKEAGGPTSEAYLFGTVFMRNGERLLTKDIDALYYDNDADYDVFLKEGDDIFVPRKPNTVLVRGEVNTPGLYKFIPGYNVKDYLKIAGSEKDSANYIIYHALDGESRKVGFGLFSGNPSVQDGGIITVTKLPPPPPSEKFDLGSTIRDVFAILSSAVTIIVLAKQIK